MTRLGSVSVALVCTVVFAITGGLSWQADARQVTRYVDVNGNDAGPGTADAPWRTIQRCVSDAQPGDTCAVGPGTYIEAIRITTSGSESSPIDLIGSEDGSTAILGTVTVSGNYVRLRHLRISMPDGATAGLLLSGRFAVAESVAVSTESDLLGLNNVAVQLSGTGHVVRQGTFERTCFGVVLFGTAHVVANNRIVGMRRAGVQCGDIDYMRLFGTQHHIVGNDLQDVDMAGVGTAHVDCFQTFDNNGPGFALIDVVIEGNFCGDAHQGLMFEAKYHRLSRDITIRNNVFTRVTAWCANAADMAKVTFVNNTCDTSVSLHGMWCRGNTGVGSCEFKNNILYGRGTAYGVLEAASLIDGDSESPGKGNLVFAPGRTLRGYTSDVINQDPLFVDRSVGDYRLLASSPARDSGVTVSGWHNPVDRHAVTRPQGQAWDIGAHEFEDSKPMQPTGLRLLTP